MRLARRTRTFHQKIANAARHAASAAVIHSDDRPAIAPSCSGTDCTRPSGIPAVAIERAPGPARKALLDAGTRANVVLHLEQRRTRDPLPARTP